MSKSLLSLLIFGFLIFCTGACTRAYMTFRLKRAANRGGSQPWSTELAYKALIYVEGAPAWPLVLTVVCIPAGILMVFGAVSLSR